MPLIQCPDCKREVSDSAAACPGCGRAIGPEATGRRDGRRYELIGFLLILAAFGCYIGAELSLRHTDGWLVACTFFAALGLMVFIAGRFM